MQHKLSTSDLVAFIRSVLEGLPSSSSDVDKKPANLVLFGELLVDVVWAVDSELDDILADARLHIGASESSGGNAASGNAPMTEESSETVQKANEARRVAEADKDCLADIVKKLLVRYLILSETIAHRTCWLVCGYYRALQLPRATGYDAFDNGRPDTGQGGIRKEGNSVSNGAFVSCSMFGCRIRNNRSPA